MLRFISAMAAISLFGSAASAKQLRVDANPKSEAAYFTEGHYKLVDSCDLSTAVKAAVGTDIYVGFNPKDPNYLLISLDKIADGMPNDPRRYTSLYLKNEADEKSSDEHISEFKVVYVDPFTSSISTFQEWNTRSARTFTRHYNTLSSAAGHLVLTWHHAQLAPKNDHSDGVCLMKRVTE
jgi:hypothetical protein